MITMWGTLSSPSWSNLYAVLVDTFFKRQFGSLYDFFVKRKELFKDNGGDTENLFFECKLIHSLNIFGLRESNKFTISIDEVEKAFDNLQEKIEKNQNNKDQPPANMYL